MDFKFGKLDPKPHPLTLMLSKYMPRVAELPTPPAKNYWEYLIPADQWQMFGNDTIGDCTVAAIAHMLMNATAHTGKIVIPTLQDVIDVYSAVTGYDPKQTDASGFNPTDNGAAITDILAYWQKNGIAGHKILGWAQVNIANLEQVKQANYIFGGVDCGFNVPQLAMDQTDAKQAWDDVDGDKTIIGGHCVPMFGYGSRGGTCITWSALQQFTWGFFRKYFDEAYVPIAPEWVNEASGLTPSGFNMDSLRADLAAMGK